MLLVFFVGMFILVARSIYLQLPAIATTIKEQTKYPGAGRTISIKFRSEQMARQTGLLWQEWIPNSESPGITIKEIEESGLDGSAIRRHGGN